MNKKGFDTYPALLLVVVIMALAILFVQIQTKFSDVSTLGEHQTKILNINSDMKIFETYLIMASKYAFDSALLDVINANIVISEKEKIEPGECTEPIISKSFEPELTESFNKYLKSYLSYFGKDNNFEPIETDFLIGVNGIDVIISARKQIIIDFVDKNGNIIYRPVVIINRGNKLREYESWVDTISIITKMCNKNKDPIICAKPFTDNNKWTITEEAGSYYIIIPLKQQEFWGKTYYERICFKTQMEKSTETTPTP